MKDERQADGLERPPREVRPRLGGGGPAQLYAGDGGLAQLLPVFPINKELSDFFNDPERKSLKGWQVFVFSALGVVGLALGAILLIAVSGLTQNS